MGVQRHNVPHFKGLISADSNPRAQERDGTFTFCHALVKKSILHLEMATVPFFLNMAVDDTTPQIIKTYRLKLNGQRRAIPHFNP